MGMYTEEGAMAGDPVFESSANAEGGGYTAADSEAYERKDG